MVNIDFDHLYYGLKMDDDDAYNQLEELVSIREPKKIVYKSGRAFAFPCCPRCQSLYDFNDYHWNFCPHCGQALDWE